MSKARKSTAKIAKAARRVKPAPRALPLLPASGTVGEEWPFGKNPRALQRYLNALDDKRIPLIADLGNGIRVYPSTRRNAAAAVVNTNLGTCGDEDCVSRPECRHRWEDDFRFGAYKGREFVVPTAGLIVTEEGIVRRRPRPNPRIDGVSLRTKNRRANIAMPSRSLFILKEAIDIIREEDERRLGRPGRGRPLTDKYDLAFACIVRVWTGNIYEWLNEDIGRWYNDGFITSEFDYARVNEAMTGNLGVPRRRNKAGMPVRVVPEDLITRIIDRVNLRLMRPFRNVSSVFFLDGVVFSTGKTDNARRHRFDSAKAARIEVHAVYDWRWGFITGFRVTWFQRGRGSGEAPQFEYLVKRTSEVFDILFILADSAYSSDRNHALALRLKIHLVSMLKKNSFDPATKVFLSPEDAEHVLREFGPERGGALLRQFDDFRMKGEGWHEVLRAKTGRHLFSHPDRSRVPSFIAEKLKENPNKADALLPDDPEERERIISEEQFTGRAVENEMRCRQTVTLVRALIKAEEHYNDRVNLRADRAFVPRPEDDEMSPFRPYMLNEDPAA